MEQPPLPPFLPRKTNYKRNDIDTIDKIEIDSDNIETPPATRKFLNYSRPSVERSPSTRSRDEEEILGDGQFDRFSSARRTRRYRKSQDGDESVKSDANDSEKQISRPTTLKVKTYPLDTALVVSKQTANETEKVAPSVTPEATIADNEPQVEKKKETVIKNKIPVLQSSYLRNSRLSATLPHSFKSKLLPSVNSEKSGEEKSNKLTNFKSRLPTKEPTITHSNSFFPEIKVRALTPTKSKMEHDLHDEGFEETQSLISDSPSQTTSSGYNYDIDNMDSPSPSTLISSSDSKQILFSRTDSSGSGDASNYEAKVEALNKQNKATSKSKPETKVSLLPKRTSSLKLQSKLSNVTSNNPNDESHSAKVARSASMNRSPTQKNEFSNENSSKNTRFIVKSSSTSKIKAPSLGPPKTTEIKNSIQRSPSKSSLKSSRSSLNSCASISTVKTVKSNPKMDNYKNVIKTLASNLQKSANKSPGAAKIVKKPLAPSQIRHSANTIVPSRSSSSVGCNEQPRKVSLNLSTSFKENSSDQMNKLMHSSSQNFMKPTASSSAKDTTEIKPKLVVRAPFK